MSCGYAQASGEVHNEGIYTSTYSLEVDFVLRESTGDSTVYTTNVEIGDVAGGQRKAWSAVAPTDPSPAPGGPLPGCDVRATKHQGPATDPAAVELVTFQTAAAELCREMTADPDADIALIASLRQLAIPADDRAELDGAFDLWKAWEDAVKLHGSEYDAVVADREAIDGAYVAYEILGRHIPTCANHLPSGR